MNNKAVLRKVYDLIKQMGSVVFPELVEPIEQSTSISSLYEQVFYASMELEEWVWLLDLYIEDDKTIFAIFSKEGSLYKAKIEAENQKVSIGELQLVEPMFEPVKESKLLIQRQANDVVRWFLIASSNVIDRSGSINSSELFDNLVKDSYEKDRFPYLTFWHQGESLKMGMTDWVAREENLLLASGTFDGGVVAQLMIKAYETDPEYWGSSISFWPTEGHMETVYKDTQIPVYTNGYFEEISILPEEQACCLFTALKSKGKVNRMKPELIEGIKKLAGDDEEVANELIGMVDEVNRDINDKGLIRRESEDENSEQPQDEKTDDPIAEEVVPNTEPEVIPGKVEQTEPAEESSELTSLEIDDELVNEIVNRLAKHEKIDDLLVMVKNLSAKYDRAFETVNQELADLRSSHMKESKGVSDRLLKLELDESLKREEWANDVPRKKQAVTITRARVQEPEDGEESLEDIAQRTVEVLN